MTPSPSYSNYAIIPRSVIRKIGGQERARDTVIRLAHDSVWEHLCSSSVKITELVDFQVDEREAHWMVGLDCLKYLKLWASVGLHRKSGCEQCPLKKPVNQWPYHGFMNGEACSSLKSDDPAKIMDENINYDETSFSKWADSRALLINKLATGRFPPTYLGGQTSHKTKTASLASTGSGVVLLAELAGYWQMIGLLLSHDAPADWNPFDGGIVTAPVEGRYLRILDLLPSETRAKQFGLREDNWLWLNREMMNGGKFYNANPLLEIQRKTFGKKTKFVANSSIFHFYEAARDRIGNHSLMALLDLVKKRYIWPSDGDIGWSWLLCWMAGQMLIRKIISGHVQHIWHERVLLDIGADPSPPFPRCSGTIFNYFNFEDSNLNYSFKLPGGV